MIQNRSKVNSDYAEIIITMLLCNHFNPENDKALRKCLKGVQKRLQTAEMRVVCKYVLKSKRLSPSQWLSNKLDEINTTGSFNAFMNYCIHGADDSVQ